MKGASPKISKFDPSLTETTIDAADEHQLKLDALVSERDSLPNAKLLIASSAQKTFTPLPASRNNQQFSNLEEDKNQEVEEEAKTAVVPKPRPPQPIHLKITENFRNQMKLIYQNFPDITSKNSGKFIKLFTKDVEEKRSLTHYLESDKDFEYFCIKPKLEKPIKVVIKGLPIFTKTLEIHSDLEEEGFTVEKVSQLISKKHKGPLPFFQITLPRNANNLKFLTSKLLDTCKFALRDSSSEELLNALIAIIFSTLQVTVILNQDV
ncbi:uncharacterized protein TNCV_1393351 [Trichonephila clavipes]|nr:uncharacterized protein TNCV_1393351 [Trichonephila clavipes]